MLLLRIFLRFDRSFPKKETGTVLSLYNYTMILFIFK